MVIITYVTNKIVMCIPAADGTELEILWLMIFLMLFPTQGKLCAIAATKCALILPSIESSITIECSSLLVACVNVALNKLQYLPAEVLRWIGDCSIC